MAHDASWPGVRPLPAAVQGKGCAPVLSNPLPLIRYNAYKAIPWRGYWRSLAGHGPRKNGAPGRDAFCMVTCQKCNVAIAHDTAFLDFPCGCTGHGEEDLSTAERGLSTTSNHSHAPEIPLGHEPSPTGQLEAGAAGSSGAKGPVTPTSPFEANVAAVNQADKVQPQSPSFHIQRPHLPSLPAACASSHA